MKDKPTDIFGDKYRNKGNNNCSYIPVVSRVLCVHKNCFLRLFSVAIYGVLTVVSQALAQSPSAPQNTNTITGFVFNESRAPIGQLYIELQSDFYSAIGRVRTQNSGMFSFSGLAPGHYYLRVITTGTDYEEQTKSVTLAAISRRLANTEQVEFYLRSRKSGRLGPSMRPGVVFFQELPPEAEALYNSALEDLASKRQPQAFEKLKRALEIFPNYYSALDRLGNEYVLLGHYEAAFVLLTKALMVNQRSYSSTMGLGIAVFRLNQTDLATKHFRSAAELEPGSPNAHLWLGIALHAGKKLPESLKSLIKANDLSKGEMAEVHWQLARVYKDMNQFARSADELELFLKLDPEVKNVSEIRGAIEKLREKK